MVNINSNDQNNKGEILIRQSKKIYLTFYKYSCLSTVTIKNRFEINLKQKEFNKIVRENHEKVYSLFRGMVSTHEEADDLTQETFIKVYKNLDKFKGSSKMFTWIYRIAVNTGINHLRKEKLKRFVGLDNVAISADDEPNDLSAQTRSLLTKGIKQLPSKQQMVVMLRSYQELSYREIANIMNISINSAKVNYSHAVRNLKVILEKMGVEYEAL